MRSLAVLLLVPSLMLSAGTRRSKQGPVNSAKEAKSIAELATSGIAISARRIQLNAASGGWEVDVHMPREERGWRCVIDNDTHMVRTKDRIPNPKVSKGHH